MAVQLHQLCMEYGATSQSISVNAEGTYTVTITDAKGCQTTSSIVINVLDVRYGNNNDKVSTYATFFFACPGDVNFMLLITLVLSDSEVLY